MSLTTAEKVTLREHAADSMLDTCKLGALSAGDGWGSNPAARTWTYGSAIACGVGPWKSREVNDGSEATLTDIDIRLPHGTAVDGQQRIQVTHRNGEALSTAEYYAIVGTPHSGLTGIVCACKRLVGASLA